MEIWLGGFYAGFSCCARRKPRMWGGPTSSIDIVRVCSHICNGYDDILTKICSGNLPVFRSTEELVSPEIKRQRIHHMAERCVSGEFGGSAWHATKSPTTARMGISIGAIQRQMRRIDPVALADRLADRERATAETSASEAAGHIVDIVFVERGGSASARKALVKITHKLQGTVRH